MGMYSRLNIVSVSPADMLCCIVFLFAAHSLFRLDLSWDDISVLRQGIYTQYTVKIVPLQIVVWMLCSLRHAYAYVVLMSQFVPEHICFLLDLVIHVLTIQSQAISYFSLKIGINVSCMLYLSCSA